MKLINLDQEGAIVSLTETDLILIANSINEAMELGAEFSIRVGVELAYAKQTLRDIHDLLEALTKSKNS